MPQFAQPEATDVPRRPGPLRVLFLSRIDPVKNLAFALRVLSGMTCEIEFNIAGPIGNDQVWADCQTLMQALPGHIRARYLGAVPHAGVAPIMAAIPDNNPTPVTEENLTALLTAAWAGEES